MTLTVLVVLIFAATLCMILKWYRSGHALYFGAFILFLAVSCGPIPAWLLGELQSPYVNRPVVEWSRRNAIVLLGAGTERIAYTDLVEPGALSYARLVETVELYRDCQKMETDCKIIISGGDAQHNSLTEAALYHDVLVRVGVNSTDVVTESNSKNTWQNAKFTSAALKKYRADRVVLVSSGIHLQRGVLYFSYFGVPVTPVRADYLRAVFSLLPLSSNLAATDLALHEYIGIVRYHLYNAMGIN